MEKHLHILSFDVPYPADYGGVIDVFFKLKELHAQGVKLHLHAFEYGRERSLELDKVCASVHYYKRDTSLLKHLSFLPYIVASRNSQSLIKRLLEDDYPILMEGMHTTVLLLDKRFAKRRLIYRESNIEHQYYAQLVKRETHWLKKLFFSIEAWKLKQYEPHLQKASMALVVSTTDTHYLQSKYPDLASHYLPSFHPSEFTLKEDVKEPYILFHGNLSVAENADAAIFLAAVLKETPYRFVLAGKHPRIDLIRLVKSAPNIKLVCDPDDATMQSLVSKAQVNLLYTAEPAGLKLKLLNVLFNGGHVVCNDAMLVGTGLEALCHLANNEAQLKHTLNELMQVSFNKESWNARKQLLYPRFSNEANAHQLIELVFGAN